MASRTRERDAHKQFQLMHESTLDHQRQAHQSEFLVQEEQSRRLRVRKHLLQDDVDCLRNLLVEKETRLQDVSSALEQARLDVDSAKTAQAQSQQQLQMQKRELAQLKAELQSVTSTTEDTAKHLTEKLALARELGNLKPEVEHLRSQLVHHQAIISEKLSLERQLNTAEVELAAEKKARQDATKRGHDDHQAEDDLRRQLRECEKKLAAEQREAEKMRRLIDNQELESGSEVVQDLRSKLQFAEQQLAAERHDRERAAKHADVSLGEAQAKIDVLEQRLDSMKSKLRSTQSDLKAAQAQHLATRMAKPGDDRPPIRSGTTKSQMAKKRIAQEISLADKSLDSPDSDNDAKHKASKKRAADSSVLGEKSLFSITPFLNRNKTLGMDAVAEEDEADASHIPLKQAARPVQQQSKADDAISHRAVSPAGGAETTVTKVSRPRGRPKKVLADSSTNISISMAAEKSKTSAPNISAQSSQVNGELDLEPSVERAIGADKPSLITSEPSATTATDNGGMKKRDLDQKKKKRKLVADTSKTIFDEPNVDAIEPHQKRNNKVQLHGPGRAIGRQKMGMSRNAFGGSSFSPLKKDRRGVGASFLA